MSDSMRLNHGAAAKPELEQRSRCAAQQILIAELGR